MAVPVYERKRMITLPDERIPLMPRMTPEEIDLFNRPEAWGDEDDHAARGAVYLDRVMPGWADVVVINDLDLGSTCSCVLGQVFKPLAVEIEGGWKRFEYMSGFSAGKDLLDLEDHEVQDDEGDYLNAAVFFGFDHSGRTTYDGLTAAWVPLIEARKAAQVAREGEV